MRVRSAYLTFHPVNFNRLLMYIYEHTQPGTFIRVMMGSWVVAFGVLALLMLALGEEEGALVLGGIMVMLGMIFGIIFVLFHSLSVRVSPSDIALSFGVGLLRKKFSIADICSVKVVRNRWYNGFGIKKIRGGWLYNVSGLDAIEIQLENKRKYRIGTDQPKELLLAVESALAPNHIVPEP